MLIIALLFGLGGIIFIGWLFGFFPPPLPEPKYRSQDFKPDQLPAKSTKLTFHGKSSSLEKT
ncbi:hypothetical protein [Nostoc favosum]|uniref:Uncharacterized protein n=1 Tax=Nostoc favosum CHAB5714 TaxID=2780399 RepID=A0ABS8IIB7_9NOSO|nr:hypothetical protein [Nostoc favosum]MCC5603939.1 hypothetical protein [Nostoc favosum CHAB5714]